LKLLKDGQSKKYHLKFMIKLVTFNFEEKLTYISYSQNLNCIQRSKRWKRHQLIKP